MNDFNSLFKIPLSYIFIFVNKQHFPHNVVVVVIIVVVVVLFCFVLFCFVYVFVCFLKFMIPYFVFTIFIVTL